MTRLAIAVASIMCLAAPAWADFDDGMRAYRAKDFEQAFQEFQKEAVQGHDTAQFNLGVMYYRGEGIGKDLVQALSWIELSTQRGDEENIGAQEILILMLTPEQVRQGQEMASNLAAEHDLAYTPPDYSQLDSRLAVVDERKK